MSNPILNCCEAIALCGWHITTASAVREDDGLWRAEISIQDNVPEGFSWGDLGGKDAGKPYGIIAPPPGPLEGVPGVTVQLWINRPPDYCFHLPSESEDVYKQWIGEVAKAGKAPDIAWVGGRRWITKPIEWMTEPLRSRLLKKYGYT